LADQRQKRLFTFGFGLLGVFKKKFLLKLNWLFNVLSTN